MICRQPPADQEQQPLVEPGLRVAPQSGPGNLRALSKVSEEASSLEKQSSGDISSGTTVKGPGLVTDRDGRQSTSMVLGNIHEQVCGSNQCCTLSSAIQNLPAHVWCSCTASCIT